MINSAFERTNVALLLQTRRNNSEVRPRTAEQGFGAAWMRPGSGMPSHWDKRGLAHTYAVASPKGPLLRAPVRTPREDL